MVKQSEPAEDNERRELDTLLRLLATPPDHKRTSKTKASRKKDSETDKGGKK